MFPLQWKVYGVNKVYLWAVVVIASTISMILWRAESVPMVMSVPQKSLSMEPTIPTMFRWEEPLASCCVILPECMLKQHKNLFNTFIPFHMDLLLNNYFRPKLFSPALTKSASSSGHSVRNWLAPVRLPSPPITHRLVIPNLTKLRAAFVRPSLVRKSWQRALPITVPPYGQRNLIPETTAEVN